MGLMRSAHVLFPGTETPGDGEKLFKSAKPDGSTIGELLSRFPEENPIHNLLNATVQFLGATALKWKEARNNNPAVTHSYCIQNLNDMGTALKKAKEILQKDHLKNKLLNEAIGYCEKVIKTRLEALGDTDKYVKAFKGENELRSHLTDGTSVRKRM